MNIEELASLEEIRQLRYTYSWCYDSGDLDGLVAIFTDDAICGFGPYGTWTGMEEIREGFRNSFQATGVPGTTMHAVTNPIIQLNDDQATGKWFLIDLILGAGDENPLRIVAYYDDGYRRDRGRWRISRSDIRFIWTADTGRVLADESIPKIRGT